LLIVLHFRCGISYFFKRLAEKTKQGYPLFQGTGLSTGTIHAYQYCPLLLHLLFALVPNTKILPDSEDWWRSYVSGNEPDATPMDIFGTVVSCITSCLDFYFVTTKRCFDTESITILDELTGSMRSYLTVLFTMRCLLINKLMNANIPEMTLRKKTFQAIKPHLCEHYADNIRRYGALITVADTQVTEKELQYVCKEIFEQTSKTYKNLVTELLCAYQKNTRALDLRKYAERCRIARIPDVHAALIVIDAPEYHNFRSFGADNWKSDYNELSGRSVWRATDALRKPRTVSSVHKLLLNNLKFLTLLSRTRAIQSEVFKVMQEIIVRQAGHGLVIKTHKGVSIFNCHHMTDDNTNERFILHCNERYKEKKLGERLVPIYSFIEVKYHGNKCSYCRVMAIVSLTHGEHKEILLIVCRLEQVLHSPLAYPLYRYECVETRDDLGYELCCDVISVGSEFRPCIAQPYKQRPIRCVSAIQTIRADNQFFVIPYDRVGKTPNSQWPSDSPKEIYSRDSRARRGLSALLLSEQEQSAAINSFDVLQRKRPRKEPTIVGGFGAAADNDDDDCKSEVDSEESEDSEDMTSVYN